MNLKNKIENRDAQIGVIGLGYVGLPLAMEFVRAGFHVTGIDVDQEKVKKLAIWPLWAIFITHRLFYHTIAVFFR